MNSLKIGAISKAGKTVITNDVVTILESNTQTRQRGKVIIICWYPLTYEGKVVGVNGNV
jgi:hypothetical protein